VSESVCVCVCVAGEFRSDDGKKFVDHVAKHELVRPIRTMYKGESNENIIPPKSQNNLNVLHFVVIQNV
jgi:hypothetical protein